MATNIIVCFAVGFFLQQIDFSTRDFDVDYTLDSQYVNRNNFLVQLLTFHLFIYFSICMCLSKKK